MFCDTIPKFSFEKVLHIWRMIDTKAIIVTLPQYNHIIVQVGNMHGTLNRLNQTST